MLHRRTTRDRIAASAPFHSNWLLYREHHKQHSNDCIPVRCQDRPMHTTSKGHSAISTLHLSREHTKQTNMNRPGRRNRNGGSASGNASLNMRSHMSAGGAKSSSFANIRKNARGPSFRRRSLGDTWNTESEGESQSCGHNFNGFLRRRVGITCPLRQW